MQIGRHSVVSIHYTLRNDSGEVLDSSNGQAPLVYLHGAENIVPGLEQALDGRGVGDKFEVAVPPALGYGEHDPQLLHQVPRSAFQGVDQIMPGMQFQAGGQGAPVVVTAVTAETVTIDANHPLAGVRLNFSIEVVEVRESTDQERAHGHVHAGGHDH